MAFSDLPLSDRDRSLYGQLHVAVNDIGIARECAAYLKKKGWHGYSFLRRGSTQIQQIAFTTTMIVAYSRPFKPGRGGFNFPKKLLRYQDDELQLHKSLLGLRNKSHAHMDPASYEIRPLDNGYIKSIDTLPYTHFSPQQIDLFLRMTAGLIERMRRRMEVLHAGARTDVGRLPGQAP